MTIQPTNPFHISRAYGAEQVAARPKVQNGGLPKPPVAGASISRPAAVADRVSGPVLERVSAQTPAGPLGPLVGAVVPGRIDFTGETPQHHQSGIVRQVATVAGGEALNAQGRGAAMIDRAYSGVTGAGAGSYAMYRRPTDKNEAAVAVAVGRSLDTTA